MTAGETVGTGGPPRALGGGGVCAYMPAHIHARMYTYTRICINTHIPTNRPSSCSATEGTGCCSSFTSSEVPDLKTLTSLN